MCNAWNHPPGCTCGWGGEGHLGRRHPGDVLSAKQAYYTLDQAGRGYLNPNASCPACGRRLFFYQSGSGRRVFFDMLGPPWKLHPCRDRGQPVQYVDWNTLRLDEHAFSGTFSPDWEPWLCEEIFDVPHKDAVKLVGLFRGERASMFIPKRKLIARAPYFAKLSGDWYEVSTFQVVEDRFGAFEFRAAKFQSLVVPLMPEGRAVRAPVSISLTSPRLRGVRKQKAQAPAFLGSLKAGGISVLAGLRESLRRAKK